MPLKNVETYKFESSIKEGLISCILSNKSKRVAAKKKNKKTAHEDDQEHTHNKSIASTYRHLNYRLSLKSDLVLKNTAH